MDIVFPSQAVQGAPRHYWDGFYLYVLNMLTYNRKCNVTFVGDTTVTGFRHVSNYVVNINGRNILIDYYNHHASIPVWDKYPYFKFQKAEWDREEIVAFPKRSFYDWNAFYASEERIAYKNIPFAHKKFFLKQNTAVNNAAVRRLQVKEIVDKSQFAQYFDTQRINHQPYYFESLATCLAHVIVPGCRNDTFDRTHAQCMAYGIPFITPNITDLLPGNVKLKPDVHFFQCKNDYSDLDEIFERLLSNPKLCYEVSHTSKTLFHSTAVPEKVQELILNNI